MPETKFKTTILSTKMKKILLLSVTIIMVVSGKAQRTADIGIWGGTSTYFGDIDGSKTFGKFNPNFGAYYRYNFNSRVAMRAMLLMGNFSAEGNIENVATGFSKTVQDLSVQAEINYLKYVLGGKNTPFTSYVTFGLGVAYFGYQLNPAFIASFNPDHNKGNAAVDESVVTATLPFGIGFKYTIGQRLGIGIEYQMRKLFSDKLDNLDDPLAYITTDTNTGGEKQVIYNDPLHNNDWTSYLGLHITYKIYTGKRACAAYDSKN